MAASRALSATAAPRMQDMDSAAQERLRKIDAELDLVKQQLRDLQARRRALEKERAEVLADQQDERAPAPEELIDYHTARFPWLSELLRRAQTTFGISAFRLCQEGVCNAVLDQRDVMVVMPTGGGKSLCYQLPALLCDGMVLVVSPLIALMTDQVYHLRARDIPCALLSSAVPKEDAQVVLEAVRSGHNMPKLLYVTPERLAKSKTLLSALQCAYEAGRLARVVIDEAHCCSMMGHDYRPDYHKLSLCRKLFPQTPIMGLTATLSRQALHDVLDILGLRAVTDASHAHPRRTVYFRAPLHRPNLHYRVRTRAAGTLALHESLCAYILGRHAGASGIVYCLSRKDTHTIADALQQLSGGQIRTSVYHSDLDDAAKHDVHAKWRTGEILVVCATIAFGMGIDKGDVRFVVHACIPKSLDGYYQETGRAGRDGQMAECVLLYRPGDLSRVSAMTASEAHGQEKLYAMLDYAQSPECRRVLFARYFEEPAGETCGVCDNCERGPPDTRRTDVSLAAWQIVRALQDVDCHGGRITLTALADIVRGLQHGKYKIADDHGRPSAATRALDFGALNGKVQLGREVRCCLTQDTERVIVALLLRGYVQESFQATAYTVNVYVRPGPRAPQLAQLTPSDAASARGLVSCVLLDAPSKRPRTTAAARGARGATVAAGAAASAGDANHPVIID